MPHVIAWCGFLGAWFLVIGPLDQAVREVEDVDFERDAITEAASHVEEPPQVSTWWILLPPVWFFLRWRRENEYRRRVGAVIEDRHLASFLAIKDILNAWAYIAFGASLIAVKETWELHEAYEWPESVFWGSIVLMVLVCVGSTLVRARDRHSRPALGE